MISEATTNISVIVLRVSVIYFVCYTIKSKTNQIFYPDHKKQGKELIFFFCYNHHSTRLTQCIMHRHVNQKGCLDLIATFARLQLLVSQIHLLCTQWASLFTVITHCFLDKTGIKILESWLIKRKTRKSNHTDTLRSKHQIILHNL